MSDTKIQIQWKKIIVPISKVSCKLETFCTSLSKLKVQKKVACKFIVTFWFTVYGLIGSNPKNLETGPNHKLDFLGVSKPQILVWADLVYGLPKHFHPYMAICHPLPFNKASHQKVSL